MPRELTEGKSSGYVEPGRTKGTAVKNLTALLGAFCLENETPVME